MISLLLSFILSLVSPTPLGQDGPTPAAPEPSVRFVGHGSVPVSAEWLTVCDPYGGLGAPEDILGDLGSGIEVGETDDSWSRILRLLRHQAPGCSSGHVTADRRS